MHHVPHGVSLAQNHAKLLIFAKIVVFYRQHNLVPLDGQLRSEITHVILAFMRSEVFGKDKEADVPPTDFPLFTTVDKVRSQFDPGTKVMVAIGGWGDVSGFQDASRHQETRQRWAARVRDMVDVTGADGVDIDWEYPG